MWEAISSSVTGSKDPERCNSPMLAVRNEQVIAVWWKNRLRKLQVATEARLLEVRSVLKRRRTGQ